MKKKNILLIGLGAALTTAAAIFIIRKRKSNDNEQPPKNAPQLDLENPGDQSDFPKSASESELG